MYHDAKDRRVQRTRQTLRDALATLIPECDYDAITVQNILDRANVGRSTFYAHYRDKDDLLLSGLEQLHQEWGRSRSPEQPIMRLGDISRDLFQHAEGMHRLYIKLSRKPTRQRFLDRLQRDLTAIFSACLKRHLPPSHSNAVPLELLVHSLISVLLGLMTWWLEHDLPYSSKQMDHTFKTLMTPALEELIGQNVWNEVV